MRGWRTCTALRLPWVVKVVKRIYPQEAATAEELSCLPCSLQQPTGAGLEACLHFQHHRRPGLACRPLCVCRLYQGLILSKRISSLKCQSNQERS